MTKKTVGKTMNNLPKINNESLLFPAKKIAELEKQYRAKYICDSQLIDKNNEPLDNYGAYFYSESKHPEGSHYFVIFCDSPVRTVIANGDRILTQEICAIGDSKEIIFSRHRHDFRTLKSGIASIDGGREYFRVVYNNKEKFDKYALVVEKDKLVIKK